MFWGFAQTGHFKDCRFCAKFSKPRLVLFLRHATGPLLKNLLLLLLLLLLLAFFFFFLLLAFFVLFVLFFVVVVESLVFHCPLPEIQVTLPG